MTWFGRFFRRTRVHEHAALRVSIGDTEVRLDLVRVDADVFVDRVRATCRGGLVYDLHGSEAFALAQLQERDAGEEERPW